MSFATAAAQSKDQTLPKLEYSDTLENAPARVTRIELTPNPDAKFYEVSIVPRLDAWKKPLKLKFLSTLKTLRLRLTPGMYYAKTRSVSAEEIPGPWSQPMPFKVDFKSSTTYIPADGSNIEPRGTGKEIVTFEWSSQKKVRDFLFVLRDKNKKVIHMVKTPHTWHLSPVASRATYSWHVIPFPDDFKLKKAVMAIPESDFKNFTVLTPSLEGRRTQVQIKPDPKAYRFQFEVVSVNREDNTSEPSTVESNVPEMNFKLSPGEYEIRARQIYPDESSSEWSAPGKFFVRRYFPAIQYPSPKEVIDPQDDIEKVRLEWKLDKDADEYQVYIWSDKNELIETVVVKENFYVAKLASGGNFKWAVRALSAREPVQIPLEPEQHAKSSFSIDKYISYNLLSAEESSQYYAWYRQISSLENYRSKNYENNAIVRQDIYGGESEGAIGYWWRKNKVGVMGHSSFSGLMFRGKIYTYQNFGAHLGYRKILDDESRLRMWLGVNFREMPEVLTHPFTTEVIYSKIRSLGPQFQVSYIKTLRDKWGLQLDGSVYLSQWSYGTPNGQPLLMKPSVRLSALTSYKYNEDFRFMGGYAYRYDQAAYLSGDTPGAINFASISGHYVSVMIEFALEERKK